MSATILRTRKRNETRKSTTHVAAFLRVASARDMALARSGPRSASAIRLQTDRRETRDRGVLQREYRYILVVSLVAGTDSRSSRYQHGTERSGARGTAWRAYERLLRTAARSVTADTIRRLYLLVRHVQPPACSPACLPAYLPTSGILPPSTAIPYAATWSVYLANVGFARAFPESADDGPPSP